ncbi:MAG: MBL fold metallo-hydrolase [Spirochaetes bacterium]|jgi:glyoxylase-like metal-dependent hydrolase (beta-lactamase superfamily II)|nr:MBL fold metallo-hydrolase [Spirochaetota bacterium]
MKKRIIKIAIISACVLIALFAAYSALFMIQTKKMYPAETGRLAGEVYAVRDSFANLYLVKGKNGFVAFDAGKDAGSVSAEIKKIGIAPGQVSAVFLTHSDSDHTGAVKLFGNAKIYLPRNEEPMVNGSAKRFLFFTNKTEMEHEIINEGQTMTIDGIKIKCIASPGHTPGSASYLVDDVYLFTGDNLSLKDGEADIFNVFFNMDSETQKKSIKVLADIKGVKYIFTAHHGYTADVKKAFSKWK